MTVTATALDRRLLEAYAVVLEYPRASVAAEARACELLARDRSPEAAALAGAFRRFAESATVGQLQEAYTSELDLDSLSDLAPTCYPYVGHHLFDESYKRSAFLVGLAERYRAHGFEAEGELPDHLVVLLRFLASCDDEELARELLDEAIVPALERIVRGGGDSPYRCLLGSLLLSLKGGTS